MSSLLRSAYKATVSGQMDLSLMAYLLLSPVEAGSREAGKVGWLLGLQCGQRRGGRMASAGSFSWNWALERPMNCGSLGTAGGAVYIRGLHGARTAFRVRVPPRSWPPLTSQLATR